MAIMPNIYNSCQYKNALRTEKPLKHEINTSHSVATLILISSPYLPEKQLHALFPNPPLLHSPES
jgi:hypothetical protein